MIEDLLGPVKIIERTNFCFAKSKKRVVLKELILDGTIQNTIIFSEPDEAEIYLSKLSEKNLVVITEEHNSNKRRRTLRLTLMVSIYNSTNQKDFVKVKIPINTSRTIARKRGLELQSLSRKEYLRYVLEVAVGSLFSNIAIQDNDKRFLLFLSEETILNVNSLNHVVGKWYSSQAYKRSLAVIEILGKLKRFKIRRLSILIPNISRYKILPTRFELMFKINLLNSLFLNKKGKSNSFSTVVEALKRRPDLLGKIILDALDTNRLKREKYNYKTSVLYIKKGDSFYMVNQNTGNKLIGNEEPIGIEQLKEKIINSKDPIFILIPGIKECHLEVFYLGLQLSRTIDISGNQILKEKWSKQTITKVLSSMKYFVDHINE